MLKNNPIRTPEETINFRNTIFVGITAGKEVKAIAIELATNESYIYTILRRAGYEKMLLSTEERFVVEQFRMNPSVFAKALKPKRAGK